MNCIERYKFKTWYRCWAECLLLMYLQNRLDYYEGEKTGSAEKLCCWKVKTSVVLWSRLLSTWDLVQNKIISCSFISSKSLFLEHSLSQLSSWFPSKLGFCTDFFYFYFFNPGTGFIFFLSVEKVVICLQLFYWRFFFLSLQSQHELDGMQVCLFI